MSNESPALLRYLPAILGAVAAIASIIYVSISFDGTDQDWESLLAGVSDLKEAGELAEHVAVADENYGACVATKSTVSILGAVEDSLKAASEGECRIPDASVDVSDCIAWKDSAPSGADVPATVELAILPVLALAASAMDHSEDEAIQSWGSAVVDWIGSGKTSIIALIEDPSTGSLSFDGVTVEAVAHRYGEGEMPIIVLPPGSGTTPAPGYSPLCGNVGVEALRLPTVLQSATTITPRAPLAQPNIVSGLLPGSALAMQGARITASHAVSSWSDLTTGFTLAWWMDPLAANNSSATFFTTWGGILGVNDAGIGDRVLLKRNGTSPQFNFEYRSGGAFVAQARTDSSPWDNTAWNHYAVTFSAARTLVFYKNGVAIQFDVTTDTGGSTPSNVTSHTYNTPIPVAPRRAGYFFGGSDVLGNDDFGGELFNMGYWNTGLAAAEIAVLAGTSKLDLAVNSGAYVSASSLKINPKFSVLDASGSYGVLPTYGQDSYSIPVGPTVP